MSKSTLPEDKERDDFGEGMPCRFCINGITDKKRKRFAERQKQIELSDKLGTPHMYDPQETTGKEQYLLDFPLVTSKWNVRQVGKLWKILLNAILDSLRRKGRKARRGTLKNIAINIRTRPHYINPNIAFIVTCTILSRTFIIGIARATLFQLKGLAFLCFEIASFGLSFQPRCQIAIKVVRVFKTPARGAKDTSIIPSNALDNAAIYIYNGSQEWKGAVVDRIIINAKKTQSTVNKKVSIIMIKQ
jgi:hypothetical protein